MSVRLIPLEIEHAAQLAYIANNYAIAKYMRNSFPHPYTYDDAVNFITKVQLNNPNLVFAIESDGLVVGSIGLFPGEDIYASNVELGYWVGQEYWGRGIATAAILQIVDYCFSTFLYHKIYANVFHPNTTSMRVLEKCGFYKEAILAQSVYKFDEYLDEHIYSLFKTL